jgi:hypothetical protein
MARCTVIRNLEVHHNRRDGGNDLGNAKVLCQKCHKATSTYGAPGTSPPGFDESTKVRAKARSGNRCECTSISGCH